MEYILNSIISSIISVSIVLLINNVWWEKKKTIEKLRFDVYMKLMELNGCYFWLASSEKIKEPINQEIKYKADMKAWEIADLLRLTEKLSQTQSILESIFLEKNTFNKRRELVSLLLEELGNEINPKYSKIMKEISNENIKYWQNLSKLNNEK